MAAASEKIHHDEARRADEVTVERQTQHHAIAEDEPRTLRSSLATNLLVLLFLLYVFFWNLTTVSAFTMPERVVPLGIFLGLNQSWDMFAPYSAKNDGWLGAAASEALGPFWEKRTRSTGRGLLWTRQA